MKLPSDANLLVHYEDFALAQSVKRGLMQLRSRPTMASSEDVMSIARKAALVGSSPRGGSAAVDKIRAEAWSAICKLAAAIDRNARLVEENRPDALVNTSVLWARAIDLGQVWMRAGEQLGRELAGIATTYRTTTYRTTTYRDTETRALPGLPEAPTLAPIVEVTEEADASATCAADAGAVMVRRILKATPTGSITTFAVDDVGVLLLASGPIVRGTEAYRLVEHLAQACNCSVSLQKKAGTISFYRNEAEPPLLRVNRPALRYRALALQVTATDHPANHSADGSSTATEPPRENLRGPSAAPALPRYAASPRRRSWVF